MAKKARPATDTKIFRATFDMIAEKGLGKTRLSALVQQTKIPLKTLYAQYPSVCAIIDAFLDHVDAEMLRHTSPDTGSKRDLYFDMMMARFDTLQPYRAGVVRWLKDTSRHPTRVASLLKRWDKSLSLMLDVAKDSPLYPVKKIGLAGVYLVSLRAWLEDESPDMSKTMATLDKALAKAGYVVDRFLSPQKAKKK